MKSYLSLLLVLFAIHSFAQELPDLKAYSNDIGFNTSILMNGIISSNQGPFDFMYKRQKSSNSALRLGGTIFASVNTNVYSSSINYDKYNNWSASFSIGKEKQKQLTKKWIFYYGADLGIFYNSSFTETHYNSQLYTENEIINYGGRIAPFLGIRFQITDKLYAATEASLRLAYGRKSASWTWYDTTTGEANTQKEDFGNVNIFAQPAAGVYVFYRF